MATGIVDKAACSLTCYKFTFCAFLLTSAVYGCFALGSFVSVRESTKINSRPSDVRLRGARRQK